MFNSIKRILQKAHVRRATIFALILFVASCNKNGDEIMMRDSKASYKDIKKTLYKEEIFSKNKKEEEQKQTKEEISSIPNISKSVISLPPPSIGGDKILSFYVDDKTPIKDALIELGRAADVDIDIDPRVGGNVIINAKSRPFKEILDRIATQAKLHYTYKNQVLYFEPNYPYLKNYVVDLISSSNLWEELQTGIENVFTSYATLNSPVSASSSPSSDSSGNAGDAGSISDSNVIVNKNSGIVTVFATSAEHEMVQKFINELIEQGSAQVLIEAKILEINLSDNFRYGIDWSKGNFSYMNENASGSYVINDGAAGIAIGTAAGAQPMINAFGTSIDAMIGMVQAYGTTRSISNPRIHAMNNTTATLKFTDKLVYFQIQNSQSSTLSGTGTANNQTAITTTKMEEDAGIEISITPSINLKTEEITMVIQPKITENTKTIIDPASPAGGVKNEVPVMNERTLSTTVKARNGNVVVIGGLMKNRSINSQGGIPILSKIPIIGWLFKNVSKDDSAVETVIMIKATLVKSNKPLERYERNLLKSDPSARAF